MSHKTAMPSRLRKIAKLEARIAQLEAVLRSAHAELTDHGHQEFPECECRIAYVLGITAKDE